MNPRRGHLLLLLLFVYCAVPLYQRNVIGGTFTDSRRILDPQKLRVAQLDAILRTRGVHGNYLEKWEMVEQVQMSGVAVQEDLDEVSVSSTEAPTNIQCESELLDQLKTDRKMETSWLIRIRHPSSRKSTREDEMWASVWPKMALIGLRVAHLECCRSDSRFCPSWQESDTGLVLVTPNERGKLSVFRTRFPRSEAALHRWVSDQLQPIPGTTDAAALAAATWLPDPACRVLFVTDSDARPPLFFAVLGARFAGRIPFDYLPNFANSSVGGLPIARFPAYVILAPGRQLAFGARPGERLSYASLEAFLLVVRPDLSSVLRACFLIVGCLAGVDFLLSGRGLQRGATTCLAKLAVLLVLVGGYVLTLERLYRLALRADFSRPAALAGASLYARLAVTDAAGLGLLIVSYWQARPLAFCAVFLGVGLLYRGICRLLKRPAHRGVDMRPYRRPPARSPDRRLLLAMTVYVHRQRIEAEILRPVDPREFEYIRELEVWTWLRHAPGCPGPEEADVCGCLRDAQGGGCAEVVAAAASAVVPAGVDLADGRCVFCQCDFGYKDTLCTLPCRHTFHRKGIHRWLLSRSHGHRCPTCRKACRGNEGR